MAKVNLVSQTVWFQNTKTHQCVGVSTKNVAFFSGGQNYGMAKVQKIEETFTETYKHLK